MVKDALNEEEKKEEGMKEVKIDALKKNKIRSLMLSNECKDGGRVTYLLEADTRHTKVNSPYFTSSFYVF